MNFTDRNIYSSVTFAIFAIVIVNIDQLVSSSERHSLLCLDLNIFSSVTIIVIVIVVIVIIVIVNIAQLKAASASDSIHI